MRKLVIVLSVLVGFGIVLILCLGTYIFMENRKTVAVQPGITILEAGVKPPPPAKHEAAGEDRASGGGITQKDGGPAGGLYEKALALEKEGKLKEAAAELNTIIMEHKDSPVLKAVSEKFSEIKMKLLFSPVVTEGDSILYEVRPGDTLTRIAKEHGTTAELIQKSNALKDSLIYPGQKLKVTTAVFSVGISRKESTLTLKSNQVAIKTYRVAVGKPETPSPEGTFKVMNKLVDPPWFTPGEVIPPGDPRHALGTRWIGFSEGYGIHGTVDPGSIGQEVSKGCIRMRNKDVEELFSILPEGAEVRVGA